MSFRFIQICFFLLAPFTALSQPTTIGLLHSTEEVSEGYTLFTPERSRKTFLINNCGEVVNQWLFSELPALTCYLLENGNLLRAGQDSLEIRDWNNNLVWSYAMSANGLNQHHDIEPLPNGNILCLLSDTFTNAEIIALGRNPAYMTGANFKLDRVVELRPEGMHDATVIWEWKLIDHLIQDFDITKPNYDVVANHPKRVNINFLNGYDRDWSHCNAIDYNASLDQILLTSRHLNELWIIDHSTTMVEAATSSGGNSNAGGDLLWRWGNPQVYGHGSSLDTKLFGSHNAQWVEDGFVDEGKISVYNNGGDNSGTFSSVHLLEMGMDNGSYPLSNGAFLPNQFDWSWNGSILGEVMLETKKCGAQAQVNGNMLICETSKGQMSEITKEGDLLWVYKNPVSVATINQFEVPEFNGIFRAERYASNFPGFVGLDLTPNAIIENQNANSVQCATVLNIENPASESNLISVNSIGEIQFNRALSNAQLTIYDLSGRAIYGEQGFSGISLGVNLSSGVFLIHVTTSDFEIVQKLVIP